MLRVVLAVALLVEGSAVMAFDLDEDALHVLCIDITGGGDALVRSCIEHNTQVIWRWEQASKPISDEMSRINRQNCERRFGSDERMVRFCEAQPAALLHDLLQRRPAQ